MTARIKDDNKKLTRRNVQLEGKDNEYRVREACGIKSLLGFFGVTVVCLLVQASKKRMEAQMERMRRAVEAKVHKVQHTLPGHQAPSFPPHTLVAPPPSSLLPPPPTG